MMMFCSSSRASRHYATKPLLLSLMYTLIAITLNIGSSSAGEIIATTTSSHEGEHPHELPPYHEFMIRVQRRSVSDKKTTAAAKLSDRYIALSTHIQSGLLVDPILSTDTPLSWSVTVEEPLPLPLPLPLLSNNRNHVQNTHDTSRVTTASHDDSKNDTQQHISTTPSLADQNAVLDAYSAASDEKASNDDTLHDQIIKVVPDDKDTYSVAFDEIITEGDKLHAPTIESGPNLVDTYSAAFEPAPDEQYGTNIDFDEQNSDDDNLHLRAVKPEPDLVDIDSAAFDEKNIADDELHAHTIQAATDEQYGTNIDFDEQNSDDDNLLRAFKPEHDLVDIDSAAFDEKNIADDELHTHTIQAAPDEQYGTNIDFYEQNFDHDNLHLRAVKPEHDLVDIDSAAFDEKNIADDELHTHTIQVAPNEQYGTNIHFDEQNFDHDNLHVRTIKEKPDEHHGNSAAFDEHTIKVEPEEQQNKHVEDPTATCHDDVNTTDRENDGETQDKNNMLLEKVQPNVEKTVIASASTDGAPSDDNYPELPHELIIDLDYKDGPQELYNNTSTELFVSNDEVSDTIAGPVIMNTTPATESFDSKDVVSDTVAGPVIMNVASANEYTKAAESSTNQHEAKHLDSTNLSLPQVVHSIDKTGITISAAADTVIPPISRNDDSRQTVTIEPNAASNEKSDTHIQIPSNGNTVVEDQPSTSNAEAATLFEDSSSSNDSISSNDELDKPQGTMFSKKEMKNFNFLPKDPLLKEVHEKTGVPLSLQFSSETVQRQQNNEILLDNIVKKEPITTKVHNKPLTNFNKNEILSGLDGFDKLIEHIDPPDELDALDELDISIQEIMVRKGIQIVTKTIRKGTNFVAEKVKKFVVSKQNSQKDDTAVVIIKARTIDLLGNVSRIVIKRTTKLVDHVFSMFARNDDEEMELKEWVQMQEQRKQEFAIRDRSKLEI